MVDKQGEGARGQPASSAWSVPEGRRTDEWSLCVVRIAEYRDRAAFGKFFAHFAPLIKAFALSGSSLSAAHADELVQEVMLKVWQKAAGFNPEKAAASTWVYTIARNCRTDMFRRLQKFDTQLEAEDIGFELESDEPTMALHASRGAIRVRELLKDLPQDQARVQSLLPRLPLQETHSVVLYLVIRLMWEHQPMRP